MVVSKLGNKSIFSIGMWLVAFYVALGIGYSFWIGPSLPYADESTYTILSQHLRTGLGFSINGQNLTAHTTPGYPIFLVAVQSICDNVYAVRIVQFLLFGGMLLWIQHAFFGPQKPAGLLLVMLLVISYPVLFYTQATLYPQTIAAPLLVLAVSVITLNKRNFWQDLLAGVICGYLIMVAPNLALTVPLLLVLAWGLDFIKWRNGLIILASFSLIVASWTVRNWMTFHEFIPLSSHSGQNLLLGNCEKTEPNAGAAIDISQYENEAAALGLNEFERDRYLRKVAVTWITNNPGQATLLYFRKAFNHFGFWNKFYVQSEASKWKQMVMGLSYGILLVLLGWRLLDWSKYPPDRFEKFILLLYFLTAFTMALFTTRIRYRLAFDVLLIIVIARYLEQRFFSSMGSQNSQKRIFP